MYDWFGLASLFNGISTLFRLFDAKAILLEEQYYLTHSWEDKEVHTFPKGICPKVNIIARLENELAYYDSAVHRFNHNTMRTPPIMYEYNFFLICQTISFSLFILIVMLMKGSLTDFLLSQDWIQGHFIVGGIHESRLTRDRDKNAWSPRKFPCCGCISHQAINSRLQNGYYIRGWLTGAVD